ncbi:MAG TPA: endonuclease NucS domain-containing protein [Stellaceae bacterium]|nr:endonuclease NucS domain-containing protein [Stellaceae bacterium]
MKAGYRQWLAQQKYDAGTITAQMHRAGRVEEHRGDLDEHYSRDRMASLIDTLRYSRDDERHNRPNPSKVPFKGDNYNNLASYRNAVERYRKFRDAGGESVGALLMAEVPPNGATVVEEELGQRMGLERDMQAALRIEIGQLEPGLAIIDEGAERSVASGFIDITARDVSGATVVVELKAGPAGQRAIAQILSYVGDVAAEQESGIVRGILVASDFDSKAKAAARIIPNLILRKYSVRFQFSDGHA